MRAVEVAKRIGITSQELRRELTEINFGIKAIEREIPDAIAFGIVRVLRNKYPDRVPSIVDEMKLPSDEEGLVQESAGEEIEPEVTELKIEPKPHRKLSDRQSIDSIKFIKPEVIISKSLDKVPAPGSKSKPEEVFLNDKKKKKGSFRPEVSEDEEQLVQKVVHKPKKRVKITHKLTLDDVKGGGQDQDIGSIEEDIIVEQLERNLIKEQKKIKAKSARKVVKKEDIHQEQIKAKSGVVELPDIISVKELAEKTGIQVPKIISVLMKNGIMATINQLIDYDTAALIASELNVEVKKKSKDITSEDILKRDLQSLLQEDPENLQPRPPVVTVMGHVDHGKTSLLDAIRKTNVIAGESGGITQHIGAYQIVHNDHKITFIDTPGHEAFTAMRARGAKITDIAILVVAADEGIKPQTIEALNHAKDAGVQIIVAINKMDKPGANVDKVKGQLAEHELMAEDWGGKTIMVPISALNGEGIPQLLEMILLVAELDNLKANANRTAVGTVIEAHLDPSLGPVATVLVNTGTLKIMDNVVVGRTYGRVKKIQDDIGENLVSLEPSGVGLIAGLDEVPLAGDILQAMKNEKAVRQKAQEIRKIEESGQGGDRGVLIDEIVRRIHAGKLKTLKLIIKADTKGSLEAITQALGKIDSDEVAPKIIHAGVGDITESDIMMASASQGLVLGFHVNAGNQVHAIADRQKVEFKMYEIIYKLVDDIKHILSGLLAPERIEKELGRMNIKEIFLTKKKTVIVGGLVVDGFIAADSLVRVLRKDEIIGEGKIVTLKRVKDAVKEVKAGHECGMQLEVSVKPEVDDVIVSYTVEERIRTLD